MSVEGLCQICESETVDDSCRRCGRLVCDRHYEDRRGLCSKCAAEMPEGEEPDRPADPDRPDGVDTYEF